MPEYYKVMKYASSFKRYTWLLALYAVLLLVLFTTDPFNSPLLMVMIPFGLIFVCLLATFNILLGHLPIGKRLSPKKRLLIAAGGAWLPVMLLILRSIDQLTARDGFILAIFIIALLLYISRTNFNEP